jgi:hypothetical protein
LNSATVVKPSDSPPLSEADVLRARKLLRSVQGFARADQEKNAFSFPDGVWNRESSKEYFALSERLFRCNPGDLRYFRFMCKCFSGYSLYHQKDADGTVFPEVAAFEEETADRHWVDAPFPEPINNIHRRHTFNLPVGLIFQPPLRLGEAGWWKNGRFISIDQVYYQERLSLLYFGGLIDFLEQKINERGEARILEIGGGYGALAFGLKNYLPQASYTIVDLPNSLAFSGTYLTLLRPDLDISVGLERSPYGFRLVPVALAQQLTEEFDLIINTLSMSEMAVYQVAEYCRLMKETWIKNGGFFYEQNFDNTSVGLIHAEAVIDDHLEKRKSGFAPANFGLLRGKPSVWQSPGANVAVTLTTKFPAFNQVKILEAGDHTVVRIGCDYLLMRQAQQIALGASLEEALEHIAREA